MRSVCQFTPKRTIGGHHEAAVWSVYLAGVLGAVLAKMQKRSVHGPANWKMQKITIGHLHAHSARGVRSAQTVHCPQGTRNIPSEEHQN